MVSGIILAAGLSTRFNGNKLMFEIKHKKLIEYVMENVNKSQLYEKIIVINGMSDFKKLIPENFKVVINNNHSSGMSSSIKIGIENVSGNSDGAMIILGDAPLITKEIIDKLIDEYSVHDAGMTGVYHNGDVRNPVIFSRKYFGELKGITGDRGAKTIVKRYSDDFFKIDIGGEYLMDIDMDEDIIRFENILRKNNKI